MNPRRSTSSGRGRRALGFTLIELLIAIIIGLFILLGLATVFLNLRQAFIAQDALAQLQDRERLALTILTTTVQSAAYFPDPKANTREGLLPAAGRFLAGQGLTGDRVGISDRILVRYARKDGEDLMDCLGQTKAATDAEVVVNTFEVVKGALQCSTDDGSVATTLVDQVTSMTASYGTDTAGNGSVDSYLDVEQVEANSYWDRVRTVRITLSFNDPYVREPGQAKPIKWTQTINLMNKS